MKTLKAFIEQTRIPPTLVRAAVKQLGGWAEFQQSARDIVHGGIDGGFHGFVYYSDTAAFFRRNRTRIAELVRAMSADMGEDDVSFVTNFNCLRASGRSELRRSVMRCLGGGRITEDDIDVANALAWFAGEEVARSFVDLSE